MDTYYYFHYYNSFSFSCYLYYYYYLKIYWRILFLLGASAAEYSASKARKITSATSEFF